MRRFLRASPERKAWFDGQRHAHHFVLGVLPVRVSKRQVLHLAFPFFLRPTLDHEQKVFNGAADGKRLGNRNHAGHWLAQPDPPVGLTDQRVYVVRNDNAARRAAAAYASTSPSSASDSPTSRTLRT